MRAVVLPAVGAGLTIDHDYPDPRVTEGGPGAVIEVSACGVCHSDLHVVDGDYPSPLPLVLGHEITGVHAELGPVMVYAPWGCGACAECADGVEMMCRTATEAGLVVDGGYAERVAVPDTRYLAALGGLDPIASAPLACGGLTAYRAVDHVLASLRSVNGRRARVGVIGAGGLGQFAIRYLRLLTDADVIAIDISAAKRETAVAIGATTALGPDEADDATLGQLDAVVDFATTDATLALAARAVRRRGIVVVVGLGGGRLAFGFAAVPHEARLMTSVWGSRDQLDELLALARREPSIVQPVEVMPLADAQRAHDRLRAGEARGRIVLVPAHETQPMRHE